MTGQKVLATGETKLCSRCGESAMVVVKDGKRYVYCRACNEQRRRLQARSFKTKKAASEAGLRNPTEWIRSGFAIKTDAPGVEVKGEKFYEQIECEPALDIVSAAARCLSPKEGATAVQHEAKSIIRPVYRLADCEARKPSLSELDPQGARGLSSAEIEQLLSNAGHLGRIAIEVRQCGGVDGPYHVAKLEELLRQDDCGMSWGFIEITTNGGISFSTYFAIDLPVGQLVTCDCSQTSKAPEYRGQIRDYSVLRDFERSRMLRHAFVEWVFDGGSATSIRDNKNKAVIVKTVSQPGRKFLAFDIETAKDVPGEEFIWKPHRPLGISCIATFSTECKSPKLWHGNGQNGKPAPKMQIVEVVEFVHYLLTMAKSGFTIVTWNGLGFDFDVLCEESQLPSECQQLALEHVDMMFNVFCTKGFPVALDSAARGTGIAGKSPGMSGVKAPQLWIQGRYQEVLDYVAQDVRTTLNLACTCDQRRSLRWITRRGSASECPLPNGWLSVTNSLSLPEPDTSWMDSPMPRRNFTEWLETRKSQ